MRHLLRLLLLLAGTVGLYRQPVAILDFASLYPSIYMAHNLVRGLSGLCACVVGGCSCGWVCYAVWGWPVGWDLRVAPAGQPYVGAAAWEETWAAHSAWMAHTRARSCWYCKHCKTTCTAHVMTISISFMLRSALATFTSPCMQCYTTLVHKEDVARLPPESLTITPTGKHPRGHRHACLLAAQHGTARRSSLYTPPSSRRLQQPQQACEQLATLTQIAAWLCPRRRRLCQARGAAGHPARHPSCPDLSPRVRPALPLPAAALRCS